MKIRIDPIQCESLGTRSLATLVETPNIKILLDPGTSLGIRFGLLPHPIEYKLVRKTTETLCFDISSKIDAIFISHYHLDHFISSFPNFTFYWHSLELAKALYTDKIIYAKHPRTTNYSQRRRGYFFEKLVAPLAKQLIWCDDLEFSFNNTTIQFSPPIWHGSKNTPLGFVIQCSITHNDMCFVFGPDSQCLNQEAITWILAQKPELLIIGGPPIYLAGWKVEQEVLEAAKKNLIKLVQKIPHVLVDHHLIRSLEWENWMTEIFKAAKHVENTCECIADYKKVPPRLLEVNREQLYEQDPPDHAFLKWTKLAKTIRAKTPFP